MGSEQDGTAITPVEHHLRLYNQYPGSYLSFQQMMEDLPRIAAMGFKQVWVNPFYETCKENKLMSHKIDCPYAMKDHNKLNPEYGSGFEEVREYTDEARRLGLVPIFDLVANHVAIDHSFVTGDPSLMSKHNIDTKKWFQRHPNGNLRIKGYDEKHQRLPESRNPWTDVAQFDYKDENIRNEIFEYFWKPFIDHNIEKLGFMGARIDAPGRIPHEVHEQLLTYLKRKCNEKFNADPYIVAETVGSGNPEADRDAVMGVATHTMNSAFWMPGPEGHKNEDGSVKPYDIWRDDDGEWRNKQGELFNRGRKNWYAPLKGILQTVGPTAGHSGSHDEDRYPHILKEQWGIKDPAVLKQRMLEMIMVAAFGSDGGHILAYGDEFGVEDRINLHQRKVIDLKTQKQYDLTSDIKQVNDIVKKLPPPAKPEWTQRVFYPKYPELVIFIVHEGEGFNCNSHLIIGNSYNEEDKHITLDNAMLDEILHANGRNTQTQIPQKIFLCGKITASSDIDPEVIHSETPPKALGGLTRSVR